VARRFEELDSKKKGKSSRLYKIIVNKIQRHQITSPVPPRLRGKNMGRFNAEIAEKRFNKIVSTPCNGYPGKFTRHESAETAKP
jgi:hypothetical protein